MDYFGTVKVRETEEEELNKERASATIRPLSRFFDTQWLAVDRAMRVLSTSARSSLLQKLVPRLQTGQETGKTIDRDSDKLLE